jgi:hypothetical protein
MKVKRTAKIKVAMLLIAIYKATCICKCNKFRVTINTPDKNLRQINNLSMAKPVIF